MLEEYLLLLSAFALPEHKYKAYLVLKIGFVRDLTDGLPSVIFLLEVGY